MRIEKEFRKTGYFWLPEHPEKRLPGTLTIINGGAVKLETIGMFHDKSVANKELCEIGRISGCIEDEGSVTLLNCAYKKKVIIHGLVVPLSKSEIDVGCALIGADFSTDKEVVFNTLSFSIDCMDEWVGISSIDVEMLEDRSVIIECTPKVGFIYELTNGMKLEFVFQHSLSTSLTEAKVTQNILCKLSSDKPRTKAEYLQVVRKISNFLSLAIGKSLDIKKITATSTDISLRHNPFPWAQQDEDVAISIYYKRTLATEKELYVSHHEMLFTFGLIKSNFEKILNKWIDLYAILEPAFDLYFSTRFNPHKFSESKFLTLVQGLETYHRRTTSEKLMDDAVFQTLIETIISTCPEDDKKWLSGRLKHGNEVSLKTRIIQIIEPLKKYIGDEKYITKLIWKILNTRNYLTHYDESLENSCAKGAALYEICLKMDVIFQLNFMKILDFTDNEIENAITNNSDFRSKLDFRA